MAEEADLPYAPPNNLQLVNVMSSKAGRFKGGSALGFDGTSIAHLDTTNQTRYNFNKIFSVQMVVHVGPSELQVLATKPGAWRLVRTKSNLEWHVNFGTAPGVWVVAASPALTAGSWVVKATVAGPTIKLHTCELLTVDGLQNRCNMTLKSAANASAASLPVIVSKNITFGGEYSPDGKIINRLIGALEEIFISKIDTSSWTRFTWNVPPTGITNFNIW